MYGAGAGSPRPASAGAARQARHLSTGLGSPAGKPGCQPGIPRMRTLTSQADGFWHRQAARAKGTTITRLSGTHDTDGSDETTYGKASMPKTIVVTSTAGIAELTHPPGEPRPE